MVIYSKKIEFCEFKFNIKSMVARAKPQIGFFFWDYGTYWKSVSGEKK